MYLKIKVIYFLLLSKPYENKMLGFQLWGFQLCQVCVHLYANVSQKVEETFYQIYAFKMYSFLLPRKWTKDIVDIILQIQALSIKMSSKMKKKALQSNQLCILTVLHCYIKQFHYNINLSQLFDQLSNKYFEQNSDIKCFFNKVFFCGHISTDCITYHLVQQQYKQGEIDYRLLNL